mmetsp:Transcript_11163/g.38795  ORF Transcript_11163/g.38795 Transcript_11163/m.38795 type:complete len:451 (+) Transcript_11163:580-1932(+)
MAVEDAQQRRVPALVPVEVVLHHAVVLAVLHLPVVHLRLGVEAAAHRELTAVLEQRVRGGALVDHVHLVRVLVAAALQRGPLEVLVAVGDKVLHVQRLGVHELQQRVGGDDEDYARGESYEVPDEVAAVHHLELPEEGAVRVERLQLALVHHPELPAHHEKHPGRNLVRPAQHVPAGDLHALRLVGNLQLVRLGPPLEQLVAAQHLGAHVVLEVRATLHQLLQRLLVQAVQHGVLLRLHRRRPRLLVHEADLSKEVPGLERAQHLDPLALVALVHPQRAADDHVHLLALVPLEEHVRPRLDGLRVHLVGDHAEELLVEAAEEVDVPEEGHLEAALHRGVLPVALEEGAALQLVQRARLLRPHACRALLVEHQRGLAEELPGLEHGELAPAGDALHLVLRDAERELGPPLLGRQEDLDAPAGDEVHALPSLALAAHHLALGELLHGEQVEQ